MEEHVHFIGIGGSGLSAIASVLMQRGFVVSGSDRIASQATQQLEANGIKIFIGHRAENIAGANLVIRSSAVQDDNVEVQAAWNAGVRLLKREDYLLELTKGQQTIAVAGTHGKTTTTAMIAWSLQALDEDPSFVIGGMSPDLGGNAHAGQGRYFVIEADEYDHMFLGLRPWISVVTNVEHDHPDCYPTYQDFMRAFESFVDRIQPGGTLVACADDPGAASLLKRAELRDLRSVSYSLQSSTASYRAVNPRQNQAGGYTFELQRNGITLVNSVSLILPGLHNVLNAVAALSVVDNIGLPLEIAAGRCGEFRGVARRFEVRGEVGDVTIIDDYAHHPTEIKATLAAARSRFDKRRIWAVWQPHTYSRIRALMSQFLGAFEDADNIVITEIYAARESKPEDGFSGDQIAQELRKKWSDGSKAIFFESELRSTGDFLISELKPGDVLLVLSAGDADRISTQVLNGLLAAQAASLPGSKKSNSAL